MATKDPNHTFKPGQILVDSWGYEQTNIDFYQITRVTSCRVFAKPMTAEVTAEPEAMTGRSAPLDVIEGAKEIQMTPAGRDCAMFKRHYCYTWNGKPQSCSWYA
jgi:hypothetical protein